MTLQVLESQVSAARQEVARKSGTPAPSDDPGKAAKLGDINAQLQGQLKELEAQVSR